MTLQTDIAQIKALCDKILADNLHGPEVIVTEPTPTPTPAPVTGSDIISVYDYPAYDGKNYFIKIKIMNGAGWLRRDWMDEINQAAKPIGEVSIRQACPAKGTVFPDGLSGAHTDAGDRVDLYYPRLPDNEYDREKLKIFVEAMEAQHKILNKKRKEQGLTRPLRLEYVMDYTLEGFMKNDWITFVKRDAGNHDTHFDLYRGREQ